MSDQFLDEWHARLADALHDGLAFLAGCDAHPFPDGVLHDWVRQLCTFHFEPRDVAPIAALIRKRDPHLQEAGVELATAALSHVDAGTAIGDAVAELLRAQPVDDWVLLAVVGLLQHFELTAVYREVVKLAPRTRPRGMTGIMRNRHIDPYRELDQLYEQNAIQTLVPQERDLCYLPLLEARLGTRGWAATQRRILEQMGFDPDEHLKLLRR